jgi:hypothetical protein
LIDNETALKRKAALARLWPGSSIPVTMARQDPNNVDISTGFHCAGQKNLTAQNGSMKTPALLIFAFIAGVALVLQAHAETQADTVPYGSYPANYKEIVTKWLDTQLIDAESARIEWDGDPKPANLGTKDKPLYGYLVSFKVNARNRFGVYTGVQSHGALIRNGQVIKGLGIGY